MLKLTLHMQHKDMRPSVNFQTVSMWRSKNMTDNQLPYDGEGTVEACMNTSMRAWARLGAEHGGPF